MRHAFLRFSFIRRDRMLVGSATKPPVTASGVIYTSSDLRRLPDVDAMLPKVEVALERLESQGNPLLTSASSRSSSFFGVLRNVAAASVPILLTGCSESQKIGAWLIGGTCLLFGGMMVWGYFDHRRHTRSAYDPVKETRLLPTDEKLYAKGYDVKSWQRFVERYVIKKKYGGSLEKAMAIANKRGFDMWNRFWDPAKGRLDSHSLWQLTEDYDFHPSMTVTTEIAYALAATGLHFEGNDSAKHMRFFARMATVEHGCLAPSIEAALERGYSKSFARLISENSHAIGADLLKRYKPQVLTGYLRQYYRESERMGMASDMRKAYYALLKGDKKEAIRLNRYVMKHLKHRTDFEQSIVWAIHNILLALVHNNGLEKEECARDAFGILCHPETSGNQLLRSLGLGEFKYATIYSPRDSLLNPWYQEPKQSPVEEGEIPVYHRYRDEGMTMEEGLLLGMLLFG